MKEKTKGKKCENTKGVNELKKQVKGITLIALVVTIIVLLILAGVAISLTIGQNGIISRAQEATVIHENASVYEQLQFVVLDYQMSDVENSTETEILSKLKEDGYVNEDNTLNIERLMGRRLNTGRGSLENGDVYVLEQRQETASSVTSDVSETLKYYLIYYGENNSTSTNLGLAFEGKEELEPTDPSLFVVSGNGTIRMSVEDFYSKDDSVNVEVLVIPEKIDGITVTKIDFMGQVQNLSVKKIIMPDTVKSIAQFGMTGFKGIEEIKLSNSLESIGSEAFMGCSRLKTIEIPSTVNKIGYSAFDGCTNLKEIYINRNLNEIEIDNYYDKENEAPWGADNADIIYKPYEEFCENYLSNKTQGELEELLLKSWGYIGTFEECLNQDGITREDLEKEAEDNGISYSELLEQKLKFDENSWLYVEFDSKEAGILNKNVDELEQLVAEKYGAKSFEQLLANQNMTREQFLEAIKEEGFREEIDFLKCMILY